MNTENAEDSDDGYLLTLKSTPSLQLTCQNSRQSSNSREPNPSTIQNIQNVNLDSRRKKKLPATLNTPLGIENVVKTNNQPPKRPLKDVGANLDTLNIVEGSRSRQLNKHRIPR